MKHINKFESMSWRDKKGLQNEKIVDYIKEVMVEFKEKYRMVFYTDDATSGEYNEINILIALPGISMDMDMSSTRGIKQQITKTETLLEFLKEVDYIVEKVCVNNKILESTQMTDRELILVFSW